MFPAVVNRCRMHRADDDRRDLADMSAGITQALDDITQLAECVLHSVNARSVRQSDPVSEQTWFWAWHNLRVSLAMRELSPSPGKQPHRSCPVIPNHPASRNRLGETTDDGEAG